MREQGKPKTRYRTTNWGAYNASLKARGSLTVWLDKGMQWLAPPRGKRGRSPIFSDAAVQFSLSIKTLAYWRANSSPKPPDAPVMRTQDALVVDILLAFGERG